MVFEELTHKNYLSFDYANVPITNVLNSSLFIARRLAFKSKYKKSFARPIMRFAVLSMTMGMAVMLIAIAIVTGFQKEIRDKVIGFGSHITITSLTSNRSMESSRLSIHQEFYPGIDTVKGIRHIQIFATKPGILETEMDVQGVVVKGIGADFDWDFFGDKIVSGKRLSLDSSKVLPELIVSQTIANRLKINSGDRVQLYYPDPKKGLAARNYTIVGIYHTGLADFDKEWILTDVRHLQQINHWGIRGNLMITDSCNMGRVGIAAKGYGGQGAHTFTWSDSLRSGPGPHYFEILSDTTIQVIISDITKSHPDTLGFRFLTSNKNSLESICAQNLIINSYESGSTDQDYVGGFEIILDNYDQLLKMDDLIYDNLDFGLKTQTITDQVPEIFNWLEMLDTNVFIIIALMILVSVINISSALLILILERTNTIGLLKVMGSSSWNIRKIFIYQAAYIIIKGLFWGNLLGIGLVLIQKYTHFFSLEQANYFLSFVPVNLTLEHVLILNAGVLIISITLMILPSYYISKISPVKAIRFN
jgi:lipoprotein-releasing system permease protein